MTSIERTAYPRFKRYYTPNELKNIYTPTTEDKLFATEYTRNDNNYLNLLVALKSFQRLGYFPKLEQIPLSIINHLKKILCLSEEVTIGYVNPRTYHRHQHLIREKIKVNKFDNKAQEYLEIKVKEKAYLMGNPADLINVAIEELVKERLEKQKERQQQIMEKLISAFGEILILFGLEKDNQENQNEKLFNQIYSVVKTYDEGEPILKKVTKNEVSPTLKNLEAIIEERMPNYNLIDILKNVDYWTNFTRHFAPLSGSDPKIDNPTERYLLTTFTYGCNLGASQAEKHMRDIISSKLISFINRRHISIDGD